jgi:hypothetical protein
MKSVHLALLGSLALATACLPPPYRPPTANEPHAVVKFRRVYQESPGTSLDEVLMIGEESLFRQGLSSSRASAPLNDALLIHPRDATFAAQSWFSHSDLRRVQETYYEQESYQATESYSCGTSGSFRMCTRSVTRYRSVPRQRWVTKNVSVIDSSCSSQRSLLPRVGGVYLLELAYRASGSCTLSCYEQVSLPDGQFNAPRDPRRGKNQPCPAAPPPAP